MNIHSICLVKDEADIVGDVLLDAIKWSDYIYLYDNGSTDGTTAILKDLCKKYNNIIFYKWSDRVFHNTIRQEVFHAFKDNSKKGDWWCRLDADEFYIDDPREFLKNIGDRFNAVLNSSYNFYFTDKDLQLYQKNPDAFTYKNLKYYKNNCAEIRFVKDNGNLYWPPSGSWPIINMKIYEKKIRLRHYQYRDPQQIIKRTKNRELAYKNFDPYKKRNIGTLGDSAILNSEERIIDHEILNYDDGDQNLIAGESIAVWKPDDSFTSRFKIFLKNVLFQLNLLQYIYKALGKDQ